MSSVIQAALLLSLVLIFCTSWITSKLEDIYEAMKDESLGATRYRIDSLRLLTARERREIRALEESRAVAEEEQAREG